MAQDLINVNDICKSFLVTESYGINPIEWPRETIAACKITCTDKYDKTWVSHQIYRNDGRHAEVKLIEYLEKALHARGIEIEVYMNYSPCSGCAKIILQYIKGMKSSNREIKMTITFANFYKTHVYSGGTRQVDADRNIKGIKDLCAEPGVKLQLFGIDVAWEKFLGMSEFFSSLTNEEKKRCLNKANSPKRKDREEIDKTFWNNNNFEVGGLAQIFKESTISDDSEDGNND